MENGRNIENAKEFEGAIEIIPQDLCSLGIWALRLEFAEKFGSKLDEIVLIPIERGGCRVGEAVISKLSVRKAPMRMSYYDEKNQRLLEPICKKIPDINKIIAGGGVRDVVFAEGVVDSEGTIKKSIEVVNGLIDFVNRKQNKNYQYPNYHVFALVSKINGGISIPDFTYAFSVDSRIWVHGWGVDNGQKGRALNSIAGVLSPYAESVPQKPYFTPSEIFKKYFVVK